MPDLDDELTTALDRLEELLLHIAVWIDDEPQQAVPPPIGDGTALAALRRPATVIRPTQGRADGPGLYAPDGRYEHVPLRAVATDPCDINALHECAV